MSKIPTPMRVSDRKSTRLQAAIARQAAEAVAQRQAQSFGWLDQLDAELVRHRVVIQALGRLVVERVPLRRRVREYFSRLWQDRRLRPLTLEERFEALKTEEFDRFRQSRACEAVAAGLHQLAHVLAPPAAPAEEKAS